MITLKFHQSWLIEGQRLDWFCRVGKCLVTERNLQLNVPLSSRSMREEFLRSYNGRGLLFLKIQSTNQYTHLLRALLYKCIQAFYYVLIIYHIYCFRGNRSSLAFTQKLLIAMHYTRQFIFDNSFNMFTSTHIWKIIPI